MKTKAYTVDGSDRFLVFPVETEEDLKSVERFVGSDYRETGSGGPGVRSEGEVIPVEVGNRIVHTSATPQLPVYIQETEYQSSYLVYDEGYFNDVFKEVRVAR